MDPFSTEPFDFGFSEMFSPHLSTSGRSGNPGSVTSSDGFIASQVSSAPAERGSEAQSGDPSFVNSVRSPLPQAYQIASHDVDTLDRAISLFGNEIYTTPLEPIIDRSGGFVRYVRGGNGDGDQPGGVHENMLPHDSPFRGLNQIPEVSASDIVSSLEGNLLANGGTNTFLPSQNTCRRSLPRRRSRYFVSRAGTQIDSIFVPENDTTPAPLQRWQESPPEDEPAPLAAIIDAVQKSWSEQEIVNEYNGQSGNGLAPGTPDAFRTYRQPGSRAASTTSAESEGSASSRHSGTSRVSNGSRSSLDRGSRGRISKNKSLGRKGRTATADGPRIFCCTFCCDRFKSKYDWMRHEKSLHLNLENWACAPFGGAVTLESTGRVHCAYCNQLDPTPAHLEEHNHQACNSQQRSFRRKDNLIQHLRHFHRLDTVPLIDDWKTNTTNFTSLCGFCGLQIATWTERYDHISSHFRSGLTMANWQGDLGLPPSIAAQVTNAVPPYLIDLESRTMIPFSATNNQVRDHFAQMLSRATFQENTGTGSGTPQEASEFPGLPVDGQVHDLSLSSYTGILTRHLSHFAQRQFRLGVMPTDEMFQQEARRLFYDCDDPWNQTIADHPQWLASFRQHQDNFASVDPTELGFSHLGSTPTPDRS